MFCLIATCLAETAKPLPKLSPLPPLPPLKPLAPFKPLTPLKALPPLKPLPPLQPFKFAFTQTTQTTARSILTPHSFNQFPVASQLSGKPTSKPSLPVDFLQPPLF